MPFHWYSTHRQISETSVPSQALTNNIVSPIHSYYTCRPSGYISTLSVHSQSTSTVHKTLCNSNETYPDNCSTTGVRCKYKTKIIAEAGIYARMSGLYSVLGTTRQVVFTDICALHKFVLLVDPTCNKNNTLFVCAINSSLLHLSPLSS